MPHVIDLTDGTLLLRWVWGAGSLVRVEHIESIDIPHQQRGYHHSKNEFFISFPVRSELRLENFRFEII